MRRSLFTAMTLFAALAAAAAATAATPDLDVHGTVSQGYLKSSDYDFLTPNTVDGTFAFNEALLNISTRVDSRTRIGVQLIARDLGSVGNNEFVLDWAFGDYRWRDWLGFRLGKVKTPLGLYNKTRDVDFLRTAVLMPQSVYNEDWRPVTTAFEGASAYGSAVLGGGASLDYEVFGGTIEMDESQFLRYVGEDIIAGAPVLGYDIETEWCAGAQVILNTPVDGLRVGATYESLELNAQTRLASGTAQPVELDMALELNHVYVLSAEYTWNDLTLAGEYTRVDADFTVAGIPYPVDLTGDGIPDTVVLVEAEDDDRRGGWYLSGSYRFDPRFELGSYYSVYYPDWRVRDGEGLANDFNAWTRDLCVTARFDLTDHWLMKAEAHFMNGTGRVDAHLNPGHDFAQDSWTLLALKSSFYF